MPSPVYKKGNWWVFKHDGYESGPYGNEDQAWRALRNYVKTKLGHNDIE